MGAGARRVTLVQNPAAGGGAAAAHPLVERLSERGHEVRAVSTDAEGLAEHTDVVIAAGGDGTVLQVARRLVRTSVPLCILPLGTANNLARSVGMPNDVSVLLDVLEAPRERLLDIGVAGGSWGERYFCESSGVGWFADALQVALTEKDKPPERALAVLLERLAAYQPRKWTLSVDGADLSGTYLSIEVLNARSFGPNMDLGVYADPFDATLDVVLLRPRDAQRLAAYLLERSRTAHVAPPRFESCKAKHVHLVLEHERLRIDDAVRPKPDGQRSHFADLRLLPGAVRLWLPP